MPNDASLMDAVMASRIKGNFQGTLLSLLLLLCQQQQQPSLALAVKKVDSFIESAAA